MPSQKKTDKMNLVREYLDAIYEIIDQEIDDEGDDEHLQKTAEQLVDEAIALDKQFRMATEIEETGLVLPQEHVDSGRLKRFKALANHPMLSKTMARLTKPEKAECEQFIIAHEGCSKNEFAEAVNRWYIDNPNKPKHLTDMWALVLQSN